MKTIIDRFEGSEAVLECEDGSFMNINRSLLPSDAKEGDCVVCENDSYRIHITATRSRKKNISKLMDELWE